MSDVEENRILQFRCAETGRRFIVIFSRKPPSTRFKVVNVVDEGDVTTDTNPDNPIKLLEGSVQRILSPLPALASDASRLFQRFFSPNRTDVSLTRPDQSVESVHTEFQDEEPDREIPLPPRYQHSGDDFNINDFDFTGWYCPSCGHGKQLPVHHRYVRCGRCGELICGARVIKLPDGRFSFSCHKRCGGGGIMRQGTLTSLRGVGVDVEKPGQLKGKPAGLLTSPGKLKAPDQTKKG